MSLNVRIKGSSKIRLKTCCSQIGGDTKEANAEPTERARKRTKSVLAVHKSNDVWDTLLDPS